MDSLMEDRSQIADAIPATHAQTCYRHLVSEGRHGRRRGRGPRPRWVMSACADGLSVERARRTAGRKRGATPEQLAGVGATARRALYHIRSARRARRTIRAPDDGSARTPSGTPPSACSKLASK